MTQLSNRAGLPTDTYSAQPSTTTPRPGITASRQKMGAIAAATVLLGGAVGLVLARPGKAAGDSAMGTAEKPVTGVENQPGISPPADIDVAGKVTDGMSFEQAFGAARNEVGMGGVFSWHGHWYNTFEKEEWTSLSLEQRQEYSEHITGEKLPVRSYHSPPSVAKAETEATDPQPEPTIIEGYLNGQRVMGLDVDQDGIIDTVVMDGPGGQTYRVVDATGNEGLDTVYRYDSLDGQLTGAVVLSQPFVLSNDDFSQHLENTMSQEVVNSILEPDASATEPAPVAELDDEPDDESYVADAGEPDDTYVNNGNVQDMDD